jgi:hypothetical protein
VIAALFVETSGCYFNLEGVDPWDTTRDARNYAGPYPVVAHPPCQRWGRYWSGGPSAKVRRKLGDDEGCFESALASVRTWGGVLEHPEASHAFKRFGLTIPLKSGGWHVSELGWTCCVEQGHYGHPARKATWLYCDGVNPPPLRWGRSQGRRLDEGFHSKAERDAARAAGRPPVKRLSTRENIATPIPFRDLLLDLARRSRARQEAA